MAVGSDTNAAIRPLSVQSAVAYNQVESPPVTITGSLFLSVSAFALGGLTHKPMGTNYVQA